MGWIEREPPEMARAIHLAQSTFPEFQRQVDLECFRIVPAFDNIFVKVFVSDDSELTGEHVFLSSPVITSTTISGTLASEPQALLDLPDQVEVGHQHLADWFLEINDVGVGGFTIDVLKSGVPAEFLEDYCKYPPVSWYNHRTLPAEEELLQHPVCETCGQRDIIGWIALRKPVICSLCSNGLQRMKCQLCSYPIMRHSTQPEKCAHCTATGAVH